VGVFRYLKENPRKGAWGVYQVITLLKMLDNIASEKQMTAGVPNGWKLCVQPNTR
jgi:hypothetical protein